MAELNCNKCGETKPDTEFFKESTSVRGYRYACKKCEAPRFEKYRKDNQDKISHNRLKWNRNKLYNFPPELFDKRFTSQGKVCAICKSPNAGGRGAFHADHNHQTSQPRGVLCHNCNVALGNFKDNPELLQSAIDYLNKYSEVE
jgi:protein-arginine kinase activator protein McsA